MLIDYETLQGKWHKGNRIKQKQELDDRRLAPSLLILLQGFLPWLEENPTEFVQMKRPDQKGFSLIELLIVVAIILIIAAIAIPNMLRARMQANEASAVASIHAINTAEISYSSSYPTVGFAGSLLSLGDGGTSPCAATSAASCYLDTVLAAGTKTGYVFTYTPSAATPSLDYTLNADPSNRGVTGQRSFYSSSSNITRYNTTAPASSTDAPLQ